jgi:hypothetical protein
MTILLARNRALKSNVVTLPVGNGLLVEVFAGREVQI